MIAETKFETLSSRLEDKKFVKTWLSLTYSCNNCCTGCYATSQLLNYPQKEIAKEKAEDILNLLNELNINRLTLIGGEPTKYSYLEKIIKFGSGKDIEISMVSNGRNLKDKDLARRLKQSGLSQVTISIYGPTAEIHDRMTGVRGSFIETMGGIDTCTKEDIKLSTNTVISNVNYKVLPQIINLLKDKEITEMAFNLFIPPINVNQREEEIMTIKESLSAFTDVYQIAKQLNKKVILVTPAPICLLDKDIKEEIIQKGIVYGGPCQLIDGRSFAIDFNGDILPCTHLIGYPLFNIFEDGKIITARKFRKKYFEQAGQGFEFKKIVNHYPSEKCKKDNCSENCTGGCPLLWLKHRTSKELVK
jgi:radical SAM protein with 4Fe4S-binding SPASM domain